MTPSFLPLCAGAAGGRGEKGERGDAGLKGDRGPIGTKGDVRSGSRGGARGEKVWTFTESTGTVDAVFVTLGHTHTHTHAHTHTR